ncbi:hypothetical protein I3271_03365 [Photobacterium leiognathi]|uniref:hypothetical protein n=1 Tax=Photobacterium leiognathi TaxID=553611 RepID=UPI001EE0D4B9|nr:hypothetical protein [Photobacterium leiognathi]MCG3883720.1 hypothetical protein [Photobacterium leiognathi]
MIVQVACNIMLISLLVFVLLSTSLFLINSTTINLLDEAMWNKLTDLYSSSDLMDFTSACCSNESATFMYSQYYELSIALSFFIKSAMNADELNTDVYEGLFSVVMMARRFGWNPLMEPVDGTDVALFSGDKIEVQSKKRVEPYIGSIP